MNWIIGSALRFRGVVVALALLLLLAGQQVLPNASLDVFPEFAPPLVEIQTEAPGLSTEDVESLITVPIENAVNGVAWMTATRSKSVLGLSSVVILFERGVDLMQARQLVQERVTLATRDLPSLANPPVLLSPLSSTSRVLKVGLWSKALDQQDMTLAARWKIRPRLMAIPGVANVAIWGQRDRQVQVRIDPDRLRVYGLTLDEVTRAAREGVTLGGGGFVDTPNQRLSVTFRAPVETADDLAKIVVAQRNGSPLLLGQVAEVVEGYPPPIGDAIINDVPGILLIVEKQPGGNTLAVTHAVEQALEQMRPALVGIEIDSTIFRPATFIEMSLENLRSALLIGAVLVCAVLAFFLYEWRTALISLLAMPLSLVSAALVIHYRGGAIDTMVLAGMIIALGEVVDDAIVDVENILRRLRLESQVAHPRPAYRVVLDASIEVRSAVLYASLIVVVALVPVFMMPGLSGAFFKPLATSYVLAMLASLLVALTVTPALSLWLLPGSSAERHKTSPLVDLLRRRYRAILERSLNAKPATAALAIVGLSGALIWPFLGQEFLPNFKEYDFLMHWVEKAGTSIEAMDRITIRASEEMRAVPGVRNFGAHVGRAEVADEVVGPNFTELWISLEPAVDYEATVATIQGIVDGYPGLYRDLLTYLRERVKEVLTGTSAAIVVRIYGDDLDELRQTAERVHDKIADVSGVIHLKVEQQTLVPQIAIDFRPDAAAIHGVTPARVQAAVQTALQGQRVGQLYQEQKIFDVVVRGTESIRHDPNRLGDLMVDTMGGGAVPLSEVATLTIVPTPNTIKRDQASRRIDVTCNVDGRALSDVAQEIESRVRALSYPTGVHPEVLGEYAEQQAASRNLALLSLVSLGAIFVLLHAAFGSVRLATLVFLGLPFALVGGIFAVGLTDRILSLGSLVGFVTVLGIAARNSLMLVSHCLQLEREEGVPFGPALVVQAAEERLSPILMTALTTGLALMPIALGGGRPGYEIEHPMAIVILGGLVTSTALNLFLMPALYLRWAKGTRPAS